MNELGEGSSRPRVMYVVTSSLSVRLLRGQLRFLREAGFDVTLVSSPGIELKSAGECESVQAIPVPMAREISPLRDLVSLWELWRLIRRVRPSITNVETPKAGLLGGLAAFLARVPCRIYTLQGLRLETTRGWKRQMLMSAERLACLLAQRVICVSESLRQKIVELGLISSEDTIVFAPGSGNGVDVSRFNFDCGGTSSRWQLRQKLGIPEAAPVVGFVGRFTRDKGIAELIKAFILLRERFPELRLLMVGDFEEGDPPTDEVIHRIKTESNIICTKFLDDPTPYYDAMDILALPTYREGFPNVVLEAQAAGKPVVVTNATGAVDSVIHGVTGLVVPVGNTEALADGLSRFLAEPSVAAAMGQSGRKRVIAEFQPERIWTELELFYRHLLEAKGLPAPNPTPEIDQGIGTPATEFLSSCAHSPNDS